MFALEVMFRSMNMIKASVVIPTYNRKEYLRDILASLAEQTWPADRFEVIVVDDGSTDGTHEIAQETFPFSLRYLWQANQGDATARNLGAQHSQAEILVFLDDDMIVEPDYLTYLLEEHKSAPNRITVGTEYLWLEDTDPLANSARRPQISNDNPTTVNHPFPFVYSRNMAIGRQEYFALGMMDGLDFPGSSIWCDVDFAYRAYRQGFEFLRCMRAICYHRDYVERSVHNAKKRYMEAAYRAVVLFHRHPDLPPHLPMFRDKTPIAWGQDSPRLIVRKLARPIASSWPVLAFMEKLVSILEQRYPSASLMGPLHRLIIGGYIFRGYRKGLREYGPIQGSG